MAKKKRKRTCSSQGNDVVQVKQESYQGLPQSSAGTKHISRPVPVDTKTLAIKMMPFSSSKRPTQNGSSLTPGETSGFNSASSSSLQTHHSSTRAARRKRNKQSKKKSSSSSLSAPLLPTQHQQPPTVIPPLPLRPSPSGPRRSRPDEGSHSSTAKGGSDSLASWSHSNSNNWPLHAQRHLTSGPLGGLSGAVTLTSKRPLNSAYDGEEEWDAGLDKFVLRPRTSSCYEPFYAIGPHLNLRRRMEADVAGSSAVSTPRPTRGPTPLTMADCSNDFIPDLLPGSTPLPGGHHFWNPTSSAGLMQSQQSSSSQARADTRSPFPPPPSTSASSQRVQQHSSYQPEDNRRTEWPSYHTQQKQPAAVKLPRSASRLGQEELSSSALLPHTATAQPKKRNSFPLESKFEFKQPMPHEQGQDRRNVKPKIEACTLPPRQPALAGEEQRPQRSLSSPSPSLSTSSEKKHPRRSLPAPGLTVAGEEDYIPLCLYSSEDDDVAVVTIGNSSSSQLEDWGSGNDGEEVGSFGSLGPSKKRKKTTPDEALLESHPHQSLREEDLWSVVNEDLPYYRKRMRRPVICDYCFSRNHTRRKCRLVRSPCYICGNYGHNDRQCSQKAAHIGHYWTLQQFKLSHYSCRHCGVKGHPAQTCSSLWRQFHNTTASSSRLQRLQRGSELSGARQYCFNCGLAGHLGYDCAQLMPLRHSLLMAHRPFDVKYSVRFNPKLAFMKPFPEFEQKPQPSLTDSSFYNEPEDVSFSLEGERKTILPLMSVNASLQRCGTASLMLQDSKGQQQTKLQQSSSQRSAHQSQQLQSKPAGLLPSQSKMPRDSSHLAADNVSFSSRTKCTGSVPSIAPASSHGSPKVPPLLAADPAIPMSVGSKSPGSVISGGGNGVRGVNLPGAVLPTTPVASTGSDRTSSRVGSAGKTGGNKSSRNSGKTTKGDRKRQPDELNPSLVVILPEQTIDFHPFYFNPDQQFSVRVVRKLLTEYKNRGDCPKAVESESGSQSFDLPPHYLHLKEVAKWHRSLKMIVSGAHVQSGCLQFSGLFEALSDLLKVSVLWICENEKQCRRAAEMKALQSLSWAGIFEEEEEIDFDSFTVFPVRDHLLFARLSAEKRPSAQANGHPTIPTDPAARTCSADHAPTETSCDWTAPQVSSALLTTTTSLKMPYNSTPSPRTTRDDVGKSGNGSTCATLPGAGGGGLGALLPAAAVQSGHLESEISAYLSRGYVTLDQWSKDGQGKEEEGKGKGRERSSAEPVPTFLSRDYVTLGQRSRDVVQTEPPSTREGSESHSATDSSNQFRSDSVSGGVSDCLNRTVTGLSPVRANSLVSPGPALSAVSRKKGAKCERRHREVVVLEECGSPVQQCGRLGTADHPISLDTSQSDDSDATGGCSAVSIPTSEYVCAPKPNSKASTSTPVLVAGLESSPSATDSHSGTVLNRSGRKRLSESIASSARRSHLTPSQPKQVSSLGMQSPSGEMLCSSGRSQECSLEGSPTLLSKSKAWSSANAAGHRRSEGTVEQALRRGLGLAKLISPPPAGACAGNVVMGQFTPSSAVMVNAEISKRVRDGNVSRIGAGPLQDKIVASPLPTSFALPTATIGNGTAVVTSESNLTTLSPGSYVVQSGQMVPKMKKLPLSPVRHRGNIEEGKQQGEEERLKVAEETFKSGSQLCPIFLREAPPELLRSVLPSFLAKESCCLLHQRMVELKSPSRGMKRKLNKQLAASRMPPSLDLTVNEKSRILGYVDGLKSDMSQLYLGDSGSKRDLWNIMLKEHQPWRVERLRHRRALHSIPMDVTDSSLSLHSRWNTIEDLLTHIIWQFTLLQSGALPSCTKVT